MVLAAEGPPEAAWVLVLDDYHVIESTDVHAAMTYLVDHLPPTLHLLLTTRADPPLPFARLRTRGELVEVRARDLRFTPDEAAQLLASMGLDLGAEDSRALGERTEGWAAGLQLAALSLRDLDTHEDVSAFIDAFTGSHRFVIDYLGEEVLARQPPEVRQFLLRTAVLDRLSPGLCDAVTGRADGARLLEELERGNLFVIPLDDERSWYRYHHLFADVLGRRLRTERPDEVRGLHRRASDWYAAHDLPARAVRHALAAGDHDHAARLMEEALPGLRRARQDGLILTWMTQLPPHVVRDRPVLAIESVFAALMTGDLDAVEDRLGDAERALAAAKRDPAVARTWADTEDLHRAPASIAMYRSALAQARGDVAGTRRHARQALALAAPDDHFIRGAGAALDGLATWADGEVIEALATFGEGVDSLRAAGNVVDALDATIVLADMWVVSGRPDRARDLYESGLRQVGTAGEPYPRATSDFHVGLAEQDRELDELDRAEDHLETARRLAERASITESRYRWYVAMAGLRQATGDAGRADDLLDEAERLYRRGFYPEVRPIPAVRARFAIARGDLAAAVDWAEQQGLAVTDPTRYLREFDHLTFVRLLLAQHRAGAGTHDDTGTADPVAGAIDLLDRLGAAATATGRAGSLVEVRVLQALAHHAHGDLRQAVAALHQAHLVQGAASRVRLHLDEGAPMRALLREAVALHGGSAPASWVRLLARLETPRAADQRQALTDPLSPRELEVLGLLASELSGPEIAARLFVSVNTLRTHTKRIFTKLDVTSRAAAVRRGRELGLL